MKLENVEKGGEIAFGKTLDGSQVGMRGVDDDPLTVEGDSKTFNGAREKWDRPGRVSGAISWPFPRSG